MSTHLGWIIVIGLSACVAVRAADSPTLAERLCQSYAQVETISCQVRKTTVFDGKRAQVLSRVYYQKPARLHVENVSPFQRRILADGTNFYFHITGRATGYSVALDQLEGEWLIMQQSVPASPMEHLVRLKGVAETNLPASADYPVRCGYVAQSNVFVVLSCDESNRLARIEFFKAPDQKLKTAEYEYSHFVSAGTSCWLAILHKGSLTMGANSIQETRRFDNLEINRPVAPGLFEASAFFKQVEFSSDFKKAFGDEPPPASK